jgi:hypothetical protein
LKDNYTTGEIIWKEGKKTAIHDFYIIGRTNDVTEISARMLETAMLLKGWEVETRQTAKKNHNLMLF